MKFLISFLIGLALMIGGLFLTNLFINYLVSGFVNQDYKTITKIILWFFCGGTSLIISMSIGALVGTGIFTWLDEKR